MEGPIESVSGAAAKTSSIIRAAEKGELLEEVLQNASEESLQEWSEVGAVFNPLAQARKFEPLKSRLSKQEKAEKKKVDKDEKVLLVVPMEEVAEEYQRNNSELSAKDLLLLKSKILPEDNKEEVLRKVLEVYPDVSLADEALDFLIATTKGDQVIPLKEAKELLRQMHKRAVLAGRNMGIDARKFSQKGLGDPTTLRNLYREITVNPKDPLVLFEDLAKRFSFDQLKDLLGFFLHALGSDMKSKGPSIPKPELIRLVSESRKMQAIYGVFRFFLLRIVTIQHRFQVLLIKFPPNVNFEVLSRLFVKLLQEKFPSVDKIHSMVNFLEMGSHPEGEIALLTQLKEATRHVSPLLFRNDKHKRDLQALFLKAIDEQQKRLEDEVN